MLTIYIACAIVGGLFILLSILGHGDSDVHIDGVDLDHDMDSGAHGLPWLPFMSLRFWAFGLGAFGLTGILLMKVAGLSGTAAMWLSVGTGLVCGLIVALTLRALMKRDATSGATEDDLRGLEADVLVAVRGNMPGRIRCSVKGDIIDLLAVSDDPMPLEAGSRVVIVDIENDRARVIPRAALFEPDTLEVST